MRMMPHCGTNAQQALVSARQKSAVVARLLGGLSPEEADGDQEQ